MYAVLGAHSRALFCLCEGPLDTHTQRHTNSRVAERRIRSFRIPFARIACARVKRDRVWRQWPAMDAPPMKSHTRALGARWGLFKFESCWPCSLHCKDIDTATQRHSSKSFVQHKLMNANTQFLVRVREPTHSHKWGTCGVVWRSITLQHVGQKDAGLMFKCKLN